MFFSCLQQNITHIYNLKIFIGNFIAQNFHNSNIRTLSFFPENVTVLMGSRETNPQNVEYPAQPYPIGSHQAYLGYPQYDHYCSYTCIMLAFLAVIYRVVMKRLFYIWYNIYLKHHIKYKVATHTR